MNFHERTTLRVNQQGRLEIGGIDSIDLAREFSTPLYVYDGAYIRRMMSVYRDALKEYEGGGRIYYASKAFSCMGMYALAKGEGLGADVVSGGELFTALKGGMPAEDLCLHGNNKLPREIEEGLDAKVGCFVVDSLYEADLLEEGAKRRNMRQKVLLRINPGVEAHTHAYVQTATPDSKFGFSVANGSAERMLAELLSRPHLDVWGFHCHIGSQIFEKESFVLAAEKCLAFAHDMKERLGFVLRELNLGGGLGVYYAEGDRCIEPEGYRVYLEALFEGVKRGCERYGLTLPRIDLEPGRSIVAEAGITLYTVGSVREIPGIRKYLAVDGGMFEAPRYALYGSKYTAVLANRAAETPTERVAIAGKCCESGDLLGVDFLLPAAKTGDLIALFSTGAYHYSMASHYNRNLIPPAVLAEGGRAEYLILPECYEDLTARDVIPKSLRK